MSGVVKPKSSKLQRLSQLKLLQQGRRSVIIPSKLTHITQAQSSVFAMPSTKQNGENSSIDEEKSPRPRRLKSFSEAIGSSLHNIYEKVQSKKPKTKVHKSKSTMQLSADAPDYLEPVAEEGKRCPPSRSISLYIKSSKSTTTDHSPTPSLNTKMSTLPRSSAETAAHLALAPVAPPSPGPSSTSPEPVDTEPKERKPLAGKYKKRQTQPNSQADDDDDRSSVGSHVKQPQQRRLSMHWVDYITEPGININGSPDRTDSGSNRSASADEQESEDELPEMNTASQAEFGRRKIWFHNATEDSPIFPEEEDSLHEEQMNQNGKPRISKRQNCAAGGFDSPRNNFYRRVRKDSIAISLKSRGSARSPIPDGTGTNHRNVDDLIFDMFREKDEEVAIVGTFLAALEKTGLRKDDPRLAELFENLRRVHKDHEANSPGRIGSIETLRLDRETFKVIITDNIVLISKAFRQQFVIPEFQTFCGHLEEMYWRCRDVKGGKVAAYIPQLSRVDPNLWGVSICTIDGQRYSIGDTMIPFTIQSCSKPLTYAIALNELGEDTVHQYVGQEPSGRMFNELVLDHNKKPHNPMVNAGAIIVCSLLKSMVRPEMSLAEKFDYTHSYFKKLCGGEYVGFNNAVFLSERDAADRNFALGFYMRENKCFPEGSNLQECMDYYFQICSMECNCEAMSVMAATLANGGICPVSGEKVLKSDSVRDVLSLMHSCGMYDYSGQFAFKVGLPAKSGVSGAIMLVVPNVFGMAVWSPPLDVLGNSLRGVALCQELVSVFNFHKYDNLKHASDKLDPRRHRYETKGLNIVNLLFSAASGDVTSMRRHHLSGMDMNASDYDGRTALHLAAAEGHLECVQYLLRHCHVSHTPLDRWGHLPLDDSIKFQHDDVADFLKKWAADNPD